NLQSASLASGCPPARDRTSSVGELVKEAPLPRPVHASRFCVRQKYSNTSREEKRPHARFAQAAAIARQEYRNWFQILFRRERMSHVFPIEIAEKDRVRKARSNKTI